MDGHATLFYIYKLDALVELSQTIYQCIIKLLNSYGWHCMRVRIFTMLGISKKRFSATSSRPPMVLQTTVTTTIDPRQIQHKILYYPQPGYLTSKSSTTQSNLRRLFSQLSYLSIYCTPNPIISMVLQAIKWSDSINQQSEVWQRMRPSKLRDRCIEHGVMTFPKTASTNHMSCMIRLLQLSVT